MAKKLKLLKYLGKATEDYDRYYNKDWDKIVLSNTILITCNELDCTSFRIAMNGNMDRMYESDFEFKKTKSGLKFYKSGRVVCEVSEDKVFNTFQELHDALDTGFKNKAIEQKKKLEKSTDLIDKYFLALSNKYGNADANGKVYWSGSWEVGSDAQHSGKVTRVKTIGIIFNFVRIYLYYHNQNIYLAINGLENGSHYHLSLADPNNDPLQIVFKVTDAFKNVEDHLNTQWSSKENI